jgi:hypothetical protein
MGLEDLVAKNLDLLETRNGIAWTMEVKDTKHDFEFEVSNRGRGGQNEYHPISIHIDVKNGDAIRQSVGPSFDIDFGTYIKELNNEANEIFEKHGKKVIEPLDYILSCLEPDKGIYNAIAVAISYGSE